MKAWNNPKVFAWLNGTAILCMAVLSQGISWSVTQREGNNFRLLHYILIGPACLSCTFVTSFDDVVSHTHGYYYEHRQIIAWSSHRD